MVLGTSPGALATLRAVRDAAADAASALSSRDGPDYAADVRRIDASLRARDGERYEGSGRRAILTCPHT